MSISISSTMMAGRSSSSSGTMGGTGGGDGGATGAGARGCGAGGVGGVGAGAGDVVAGQTSQIECVGGSHIVEGITHVVSEGGSGVATDGGSGIGSRPVPVGLEWVRWALPEA